MTMGRQRMLAVCLPALLVCWAFTSLTSMGQQPALPDVPAPPDASAPDDAATQPETPRPPRSPAKPSADPPASEPAPRPEPPSEGSMPPGAPATGPETQTPFPSEGQPAERPEPRTGSEQGMEERQGPSPSDAEPATGPQGREGTPPRDQSGRGAGFGANFEVQNDRLAVRHLDDRSPAARAGLRVGDQIVSVAGNQIHSEAEFHRWLSDARGPATISFYRDGRLQTVQVEMTAFAGPGPGAPPYADYGYGYGQGPQEHTAMYPPGMDAPQPSAASGACCQPVVVESGCCYDPCERRGHRRHHRGHRGCCD